MVTRKNVYELGGDWADPILWYARGVKALKDRKLVDRTSWRFYAAIHGLDAKLWTDTGYLSATDAPPNPADVNLYWNQCQHGSWYFLPWHRGYLLAFEEILRMAIVNIGGPSNWALPYWNYFKDQQNLLPPAFASAKWPDGDDDNPLFVAQRFGPYSNGQVFVPLDEVNLLAMDISEFTGVASGGSPGFGGIDTGFSHGGEIHGALEVQPHDWVHGLVGGQDPIISHRIGLMSHPDTAALDPIFWLHHANIDRLWEIWQRTPGSHGNPKDSRWVDGPTSIGDRAFTMPRPDGSAWTYTPGDMIDLNRLGYTYDDFVPSFTALPLATRIAALRPTANLQGVVTVSKNDPIELVGSTPRAVNLVGTGARAQVQMDDAPRKKLVSSLLSASPSAPPDRVFLNLEKVRGANDAVTFHVFIGPSTGSTATQKPEYKAGSIALFGVSTASKSDGKHGGQGLTYVLDITKIVDSLHMSGSFDVRYLDVLLEPLRPVPEAAGITIGRISVMRQSGK